jgi:hypothetical protein
MLREPGNQPSFADEVAEATGLAPVFVDGVLDRCCKRAGIRRSDMKPSDLEVLLPHLEAALLVYKTGPAVLAALDRLQRLATKATYRTIAPSFSPPRSVRPGESFIRETQAFVTQRKVGSER